MDDRSAIETADEALAADWANEDELEAERGDIAKGKEDVIGQSLDL